ncbi:MAG: 50S ribosomal protein L11 methyltransferase [Bacteroidales bacterium]|nr:50S ribosomal protein L11 methyltransferase [Bacteroidales bacterium]
MLHIQFSLDRHSDEETIVTLLYFVGFEGFYTENNIMHAFIEERFFNQTQLEKILHEAGIFSPYVIEKVPDQNWNFLWESSYDPVLIQDKIYVRAPFHSPRPDIPYEIVIMPKMSFGTAHHSTTYGMLEMMLNLDLFDKTILDVGTGTGILSIFAFLKKAKEIWACDIDDWSIANAKENFELNHCSHINLIKGTIQLISEKTFDTILANINKNVLLEEIQLYVKNLNHGGTLLLSGFLVDDLVEIDSKCSSYGMELVQFLNKNEWIIARFDKEKL